MQDKIFKEYEGNHWYERNAKALAADKSDYIVDMVRFLGLNPKSVAEVGCSNGYRLEHFRREFGCECLGIDASAEAIAAGKEKFPSIDFQQATLAEMTATKSFDLVVCNFVLHWVDRSSLMASVTNIDTFVRGGGTLILGDFLPDYNQRRKYHHLPELDIYTYKQDYAAMFTASGLYKEVYRHTFNHDKQQAGYAASPERGVRVALRKMENDEYYTMV